MNEIEFDSMLASVKKQFFASQYSTIKHFVEYSGLAPTEFDPNRVYHWNKQKKEFLEKELSNDVGLSENYQQNLKDRLALTNQIMDILKTEAVNQKNSPDIKEIKTMVDTIDKVSAIQDKTTQILQVELVKHDKFDNNKITLIDTLRGALSKVKPEKKEI